MPEPANSNIITDPLAIVTFAEEQAAALRQKFGQQTMSGELTTIEGHIGMSQPALVDYIALGTSTYLPEFITLQARYSLQRFELGWAIGISFYTPGRLYPKLPLSENLIFPLERLPPLRASVTLKPLIH